MKRALILTSKIGNWINKATTLFLLCGQFLLFIMFPLVTIDVIARAAFSKPIPGTYEIVQVLLVGVVFLALSAVQTQRRHVKVDMLISHLPPKVQAVSGVLGDIAGAVFFGLIVWRTGLWTWESWEAGEKVVGLISFPLYPVKGLLVLGTFLACLKFLFDSIEGFGNLFKRSLSLKQGDDTS